MQTFNINVNFYNAPKHLTLRIIQPVYEIPLTNSELKTLVDEKYFEKLSKLKWRLHRDGHAYSTTHIVDGRQMFIHRYIMLLEGKLFDNKEVDHINRNPLDNTVGNLRMVSSQENSRNKQKINQNATSQYIGVSWQKDRGKWLAGIKHNNHSRFIGRFNNEIDAAIAYDEELEKLPIRDSVKVYNFP